MVQAEQLLTVTEGFLGLRRQWLVQRLGAEVLAEAEIERSGNPEALAGEQLYRFALARAPESPVLHHPHTPYARLVHEEVAADRHFRERFGVVEGYELGRVAVGRLTLVNRVDTQATFLLIATAAEPTDGVAIDKREFLHTKIVHAPMGYRGSPMPVMGADHATIAASVEKLETVVGQGLT
jgi:hypothetical protein